MQLGVIGLGRMGQIVVDRVMAAGHDVVAFDLDDEAVQQAAEGGATPADSIEGFVETLGEAKRIWLMVPAGKAVDATLDDLDPHLDSDDIVVDGGNSNFQRRSIAPRRRRRRISTAAPPAARRARSLAFRS
jgi:6-phosphogluconate dehydrogenase (decarboxylating) (EC 1.1.1.44)